MSVLNKKWILKNEDPNLNALEKLLKNREHLDLENELTEFHDPYLFKDMEKAVSRIKEAIEKKERIIIFGDYDVDGITGTAILVHTLRHLNAVVSFRIPNRVDDGYGLSEKFIDEFIEKKIDLLITTDCGISCIKEAKKAQDNNIDVIITDHHTIPEIPPKAFAIIHPKLDKNYPYEELTGAGVAFKLSQALIKKLSPENDITEDLLDLASLGTVADLGILSDENRLIVQRGLMAIKNTKWKGLKKIIESAGIKEGDKIDTTSIGFRIAPRINAAGRIGDPYIPLFLLLQEGHNEKAQELTKSLEDLNTSRQEMTQRFFEQVNGQLENEKNIPSIIIADDPDWHVGVLGLIASRITEKYRRPAIIMKDKGGELVASARSIEGFNIIEAISQAKHILKGFGGHPQAAGLSIKKENYEKFKKILIDYSNKKLKDQNFEDILEVDCDLNPREVNMEFFKAFQNLAPFGMGNSTPKFILKNIKPLFIKTIGKDNDHLKFAIGINNQNMNVIAFRMGEHADYLRLQDSIDIVCSIDLNVWNGRESLQLQAIDLREHQKND